MWQATVTPVAVVQLNCMLLYAGDRQHACIARWTTTGIIISIMVLIMIFVIAPSCPFILLVLNDFLLWTPLEITRAILSSTSQHFLHLFLMVPERRLSFNGFQNGSTSAYSALNCFLLGFFCNWLSCQHVIYTYR